MGDTEGQGRRSGSRAVGTQTADAPSPDDPFAPPPPETASADWGKFGAALLFLLPAIFVLGALLIYPTIFTIIRSLHAPGPEAEFVGLANYERMFADPGTMTAIQNNFVWVLVAPTIATALGLVFAVLIERVSLQTAFKTVLFMPMAISFLAVGIIFRLVYQTDPDIGLANAMYTSVASLFSDEGPYPTARPSEPDLLEPSPEGGFVLPETISPGDEVLLPLIGIRPEHLPPLDEREVASEAPPAGADEITGTVWFDFSPDGERGELDPGESGLPNVTVHVRQDGEVVADDTTAEDGTFSLSGLDPGEYQVELAATTFAPPPDPVTWLGPQRVLFVSMVTWSIIAAFVWMWAGFAMIVISAGLSSMDRSLLEAARVDGATEWRVFRRVTVPLLWPVIMVVLVTLMINVLKIFDLVLVMAPGAVQGEATVLAVRMWRVAFGGARDFGLGSAIAVFLFLLVIPAMLFNIRRFRVED